MIWNIENNIINIILQFIGIESSLSFLSSIYFIIKQKSQQKELKQQKEEERKDSLLLYSIHNNIKIERKWIYNKYQCYNNEWIVNIKKSKYSHIEAAEDGNITALTWLLIHELEWNSNSFNIIEWIKLISKIAIKHNHINILLWIDNSGYKFNFNEYFYCSDAVILDHYMIALWLKEKSCLWECRKGYLLNEAIESNNQSLFDWLLEHQQPLPLVSKLCTTAIQRNQWDILNCLLKRSFPVEEQGLLYLIQFNKMNILQTIRSYKPIPISEKCFDLGINLGNYDLLSYFRGSPPFCVEIHYLSNLQKSFYHDLLNETWLFHFLASCPSTPHFLKKYQFINIQNIQKLNSSHSSKCKLISFTHHLSTIEKLLKRLHYCIHASRYLCQINESIENFNNNNHNNNTLIDSNNNNNNNTQLELSQKSSTIISERDLRAVVSYINLETTVESYRNSIIFLKDNLDEMSNLLLLQQNYTVSWNQNNFNNDSNNIYDNINIYENVYPIYNNNSNNNNIFHNNLKLSSTEIPSPTSLQSSPLSLSLSSLEFKLDTDIDPKWVKMTLSDCQHQIELLLEQYKQTKSIEILEEMSLFGIPIKLYDDKAELSPEELMIECINLNPFEGKYYGRLHMWMTGSTCKIGNTIYSRCRVLSKAIELSPTSICVLYAAILSETSKVQRLRYQKQCYDLCNGSNTIHYFIKFAGSTLNNEINKLEILQAIHRLYYFDFDINSNHSQFYNRNHFNFNNSNNNNNNNNNNTNNNTNNHNNNGNVLCDHYLIHKEAYCRYKGNYKLYFREVFSDLLYRLSQLMESNEKILIHSQEYTKEKLERECCEVVNYPSILTKRLLRVYEVNNEQKLVWTLILVTGDVCIFKKVLRNDIHVSLRDYGLTLTTGLEENHKYSEVQEFVRCKYGLQYKDCENIWKNCPNKKCYQLEKRK